MTTFVFIHGAWHGGWSWKKLTPFLRQSGHEIFTPSLTGLGERSHLLAPEIDLETHIQDIVGLLKSEDLQDVILVGHSYGGFVITGAADRAPEHVAQLVYLDAFVPEDGQSLFDLISSEDRIKFEENARTKGDGWRIPPFPLERWGITAEEDVQWMTPRVGPQPIRTFSQPLHLKNTQRREFKRTYISCTSHRKPHYEAIANRLCTDQAWRYRELAAGHDAMVTVPDQLAALLLECVG